VPGLRGIGKLYVKGELDQITLSSLGKSEITNRLTPLRVSLMSIDTDKMYILPNLLWRNLKCTYKVENTSLKRRPFPQCLRRKSPCHFKTAFPQQLIFKSQVNDHKVNIYLRVLFRKLLRITIIQSLKGIKKQTLWFRSFFTSKCRYIF